MGTGYGKSKWKVLLLNALMMRPTLDDLMALLDPRYVRFLRVPLGHVKFKHLYNRSFGTPTPSDFSPKSAKSDGIATSLTTFVILQVRGFRRTLSVWVGWGLGWSLVRGLGGSEGGVVAAGAAGAGKRASARCASLGQAAATVVVRG